MILRLPISLMLLGLLAATTLAYPTWWLATFQFRCKAPYYVESYTEDWSEWRVSSICAPGTCCSNSAQTGPLCTAEACIAADAERERILKQKNAQIAATKKMKEQQEKYQAQANIIKGQKAEAEWKAKEAKEDADRAKALSEQT